MCKANRRNKQTKNPTGIKSIWLIQKKTERVGIKYQRAQGKQETIAWSLSPVKLKRRGKLLEGFRQRVWFNCQVRAGLGGVFTPSRLPARCSAWCWAQGGQSVKTYWHGQAASPTAEWRKGPYFRKVLQLLSHPLFGQARWKEVIGQSSPPVPSCSDLRTMAASRVQQYFPKLDCAAESTGAILKRFWLWDPGIRCSQQLTDPPRGLWQQLLKCRTVRVVSVSPGSFLTFASIQDFKIK